VHNTRAVANISYITLIVDAVVSRRLEFEPNASRNWPRLGAQNLRPSLKIYAAVNTQFEL